MTPLKKYEHDISHGFQEDSAQRVAINALDSLYHELLLSQKETQVKVSIWQKWLRKKTENASAPRGLYFWGGVGRGKTYLMDTFFNALPTERKLRLHFHHFMYRVHDELSQLHDISDPLEKVADKFKAQTDILCFDELYVTDITDAMILATLFKALFARQIVLVATSNTQPQSLYHNGLQRSRFLPAIDLIEQHCRVLNVDGGVDYRMQTLQQAEIFHFPLDAKAQQNLDDYYHKLSGDRGPEQSSIEVNHRQITVIKASDGVLYATFAQLCRTNRSQNDYIELAHRFHTVLLAQVPLMDASSDDAARRFIALVDEFYERKVTLIISAEKAVDELYQGGRLEFEFQRCQSRLVEMQGLDYLQTPHLL